jgi:hypothetical protein
MIMMIVSVVTDKQKVAAFNGHIVISIMIQSIGYDIGAY